MKLITTKDYLLLIDEEAEIKEEDYAYKKQANVIYHDDILQIKSNTVGVNYPDIAKIYRDKIIGYYPLTSEAKPLDGIPLLPPFKEEVNVKRLAIEYVNSEEISSKKKWNTKQYFDYDLKGIDLQGKDDFLYKKLLLKLYAETIFGFEAGYKANTKQFSLEDIRKIIIKVSSDVITKGYGPCSVSAHYAREWMEENNNFIQSLSTQQLPKEFIPEIEQQCSCICHSQPRVVHFMACCHPGNLIIKHVDGKRELVGEYKY